MNYQQDRRPSFDDILLAQAYQWSRRGTCPRLQVGAVLARDGRSVMSGYNGAPAGMKHCVHTAEELTDPLAHCVIAVHAEANVIGYAAREGVATYGTTMYTTHAPCYSCAGLIIAAGIKRIMFMDKYGSDNGLIKLKEAGVEIDY